MDVVLKKETMASYLRLTNLVQWGKNVIYRQPGIGRGGWMCGRIQVLLDLHGVNALTGKAGY